MHIVLLWLLIIGILSIGVYFLWQREENKKVDPNVIKETLDQSTKNAILETVYMGAGKRKVKPGSETLKIQLLERLNISPAVMRKCLDDLFKKKLIIESKDAVSLTTFGVEHYEVFIKQPPKPKAKKK